MKLFACESFTGVYLSGCAILIVLADSEDKAKEMLAELLARAGLEKHNLASELQMKEVSVTEPAAYVLFDGDY